MVQEFDAAARAGIGSGEIPKVDTGEPRFRDAVLRRADYSLQSWYRWAGTGEVTMGKLQKELHAYGREVLDSRHLDPGLRAVVDDGTGGLHIAEENLVVALAINAASLAQFGEVDGPPDAQSIWRDHISLDSGLLVGSAAEVALRSGRRLDRDSRLKGYATWLASLGSNTLRSTPELGEAAAFAAGLARGTRSRLLEDPEEIADPGGRGIEGYIAGLVAADRYADAMELARAEPDDYIGWTPAPLEYLAERVAVNLLAEGRRSRAWEFALSLADECERRYEPRVERAPFMVRRTRVVRLYLQKRYREAALEAIAQADAHLNSPHGPAWKESARYRVRADAAREYEFPLIAAIAQACLANLGHPKERYTSALLQDLIVRGDGPFIDAPVREIADEVDLIELPDPVELATGVAQTIPESLISSLKEAIWDLASARAVYAAMNNEIPVDVGRIDQIAEDLKAKADEIKEAAELLHLLTVGGTATQ